MEKDPENPLPTEQLANLHDSLAEDVLDGYLEIDEETNRRAAGVVRAVIGEALISGNGSAADRVPKKWVKRTEDEPTVSGKQK